MSSKSLSVAIGEDTVGSKIAISHRYLMKSARTQKHQEHANLHTARKLQRQRIRLQNRKNPRRGNQTDRSWIRICNRHERL